MLGRPRKPKERCIVEGCESTVHGRGYCTAHYKRYRRHGDPLSGKTPNGAVKRWIEEVAISFNSNECLKWPFGMSGGYGAFLGGGAHRYICEAVHGEPPSDVGYEFHAAHSCGHGWCVNPGHLRWATPAENCKDKLAHGTQPTGERVGGNKLTESQVLEMRRLRAAGKSYAEISRQFGHDLSATRKAVIGETWAYLAGARRDGEAA